MILEQSLPEYSSEFLELVDKIRQMIHLKLLDKIISYVIINMEDSIHFILEHRDKKLDFRLLDTSLVSHNEWMKRMYRYTYNSNFRSLLTHRTIYCASFGGSDTIGNKFLTMEEYQNNPDGWMDAYLNVITNHMEMFVNYTF
jgi:hypothetical protein